MTQSTPTDRYYTLAEGRPQSDSTTSQQLRNGSGGGLLLLQDTQLIETLAHFSRERIPERVVHAKAAGAYGEFEVTHENSDLTSAKFLNGVGKKTKLLLRISTVGPERGSADTARDPRGWGMKLYTEDGNQDWVFNDTPIFFVRDPIKFPSLNRAHKRNPQTNLGDPSMFWDFHVGNPESMHEIMHLFSDWGTPASLRHINAYSGHTYKFTKEDGSFKYVKIHIKTNQGVKNLTQDEAIHLAGSQPDHHTEDLFNAIKSGDFPTWTVYVQVMDPKEAETYRWNIFDMTKVWPQKDYPLRQIGKMTLNKNPSNYFTDIEQAAFTPSNMVPGIAPSADPMLQARMFAYPDAARYRLGTNYQLLPTNAAKSPVYSPFERDGSMNFSRNYDADPNYVRSSIKPLKYLANTRQLAALTEHERWVGDVCSFTSEVENDDFIQAGMLWDVIGKEKGHQGRFVSNVASHVSGIAESELRSAVFELFARVRPTIGARIKDATNDLLRMTSCPECGPSLTKVRSHIMHGPPQSTVDGELCHQH